MPPTSESHFGKLVPGFEFLQGLASNASSALPGLGQWIAPTLDPDELEKRISELRTVQFWLEQNVRLLATTVQALEVQRMTLATLRSMNVPMAPLHQSLQARPPNAPPAAQEAPPPRPAGKAAGPASGANAAMVDPMQWWGAMTQQFTELAASAMKEAMPDGRPAGPAKPAAAQGGSDDTPATGAHAPAEAARAKAAAAPARAAPAGSAPAAKTTPQQPARRRDRSPSSPSR
jgi:hypothetical protein